VSRARALGASRGRAPRALRARALEALCAALGIAGFADAQARRAAPAVLQAELALPAGEELSDARLEDFNGDGRADLVLELSSTSGRALALHARMSAAPHFAARADERIALPADAIGYAFGDFAPQPGRELVLFGTRGLYVRALAQGETTSLAPLLACSLLWQAPERERVASMQDAVIDLDGDGFDDLALAEPTGLRIALQRRNETGVRFDEQQLALRSLPGPGSFGRGGGARISVSLALDSQERERFGLSAGPLVELEERIPSPRFVDCDGDGRLDLAALEGYELCVWLQRGGRFEASSAMRQALPLDRGRARALDVSFACALEPIDADARADCVLVASDDRSDGVRTQVLHYAQAASGGARSFFGEKGVPTTLIAIDGFASEPLLIDLDGDGARDLALLALVPKLFDMAGGGSAARGQLLLFRNQGGRFVRKPDLSTELGSASEERVELALRALNDADGDGCRELLSVEGERVQVRALRRTTKGMELDARPLVDVPLPPEARVRAAAPVAGSAAEFLLLEERRLRWVGFAR